VSRRRQITGTTRDDVSPSFLAISRVLISLMGVLLLVTPWTEGYRLLDNFPRGQDSEIHLLALLAFLGLALLLARSSKQSVCTVLILADLLLLLLHNALSLLPGLERWPIVAIRHPPPGQSPSLASLSLPLQI
jgi:hypothetical protein